MDLARPARVIKAATFRITKIRKRLPKASRTQAAPKPTADHAPEKLKQAKKWWQVAHRQIDLASVKAAIAPPKRHQIPEPWNLPPRPWTRLIALTEREPEVPNPEPTDFDLGWHDELAPDKDAPGDQNDARVGLERLKSAVDTKSKPRRHRVNPRMRKKLEERRARLRKKASLNARNVTEPDWNCLIHVDDLTRVYWQTYLRVLAMRKKCYLMLMITKPGQIYIEGKERGVRHIARHVAAWNLKGFRCLARPGPMQFDEDAQVWKKHERVYWLWSEAERRKFRRGMADKHVRFGNFQDQLTKRGVLAWWMRAYGVDGRDLKRFRGLRLRRQITVAKHRPKKVYKPWDMP